MYKYTLFGFIRSLLNFFILGFGGGGQQVSTNEPPAFLLPYLQNLTQESQQQFQAGPQQAFSGSTVAQFSPAQLLAQQAQISAGTEQLPQIAGQAGAAATDLLAQGAGATTQAGQQVLQQGVRGAQVPGAVPGTVDPNQTIQQLLSGAPDFSGIAGVSDAASRVLSRQLREDVLPGISQEAIAVGGFGGSRQQLAEGVAARGVGERLADINAQLFRDELVRAKGQQLPAAQLALAGQQQALAAGATARGQDIQVQGQGLGALSAGGQLDLSALQTGLQALPLQAQLSLLGPEALAQVGLQQQQQAQAGISEEVARFNFEQQAPQNALNQYAQLLFGTAGTGSTSTVTGSTTSAGQRAISGGLLGAAATSGNPWGIAAGALLGFLT